MDKSSEPAEPKPSRENTQNPREPKLQRESPRGVKAEWKYVSPQLIKKIRKIVHEKRYPIFLHGAPGVGKTSLAACVYRSVPRHPKWFTAADFIRMVQACRREGKILLGGGSGEVNEQQFWRSRVDREEFLFIDDIGLRNATDSAFEIIFELVNRRVGLPTLFTSNCDLDGIASTYDDRVASRLSAGTVIEMRGHDKRLEQGQFFEFDA